MQNHPQLEAPRLNGVVGTGPLFPTDVEDEDKTPCYPISLQAHGKNLANVPFLKSKISLLLLATWRTKHP